MNVAEVKEYKVGKGNPPKEYQFKPGQSGNPGGKRRKPKQQSTFIDDFIKELNTIIVTKDGQRMTKSQAMAKSMIHDGIGKNASARRDVIKIVTYNTRHANSTKLWDRLLDSGILTEEKAIEFANHRGKFQPNMHILSIQQIDRVRTLEAMDMLDNIAHIYSLVDIHEMAKNILQTVICEKAFWDSIEEVWQVRNIGADEKEVERSLFQATRIYPCPTELICNTAFELCAWAKYELVEWFIELRDYCSSLPDFRYLGADRAKWVKQLLVEAKWDSHVNEKALSGFLDMLHKDSNDFKKVTAPEKIQTPHLTRCNVNALFDWYKIPDTH